MDSRAPVLSEADVERIRDHMNAEHADDLLRFAQVYGGEEAATSARMTDLDARGLDLSATVNGTPTSLRIEFDEPLQSPDDAHRTLVDMALRARDKEE